MGSKRLSAAEALNKPHEKQHEACGVGEFLLRAHFTNLNLAIDFRYKIEGG